MLHLSVSKRRKIPTRKLSGLQTREEEEAVEEIAENTYD
jgi:hypothetical protein